ncbi:MAG: SIMPL domain-containing protein [Pseudomonadales bacterium]
MRYLTYIALLAWSATVVADPVPKFPFVILTESIEKRVEPDVVDIHFGLTAFASESEASLNELRTAGNSLVDLLTEHGIRLGALESSQIDKQAKRARRDGVYNLEIIGYETSQSFVLKLTDLDIYPSLMTDLVSIDGVVEIHALFRTTQEEKYEEEMIGELSAKARRKADELARSQSRTVKGVYGITIDGSFGEAYARFSLQHSPAMHLDVAAPSLDLDLTMMVPEYIAVNQRITAIYELN